MFFPWLTREANASHEDLFVEKVTVRRPWRPVDAFVIVGWSLILLKCVLASVAIHRWSMPIHDLYVWGPSVIFGAVCTWLYLRREE